MLLVGDGLFQAASLPPFPPPRSPLPLLTCNQYSFIEADLAGVNRTKTPWVVFSGHRPMYVNSGGPGASDCEGSSAEEEHCSNDQPVARLLRSSLEPLLLRYQVRWYTVSFVWVL